jgi:hypothetical protein
MFERFRGAPSLKSSRRTWLDVTPLEPRCVPTGSGNLLVSSGFGVDGAITEYTLLGEKVRSVIVPDPQGLAPSGGALGITVDDQGALDVLNPADGVFNLSSVGAGHGWTSQSFAGWNLYGTTYIGAIASDGPFVFAPDSDGSGPDRGIVRFDRRDGSAARFENQTDTLKLTLGGDGLLYALANEYAAVQVYDPISMQLQRSFTLALPGPNFDTATGLAVDAAGEIFASTAGGRFIRDDPTGQTVEAVVSAGAFLSDIALSDSGQLVAANGGQVYVTNHNLDTPRSFPVDAEPLSRFLAFGSIPVPPAPATLAIADQSAVEGTSGETDAVITVSLGGWTTDPVTVHFATADGSAIAGTDYGANSGDLTFQPGQTTKTFLVPVVGDTEPGPNKTVQLLLSNAVGATVVKDTVRRAAGTAAGASVAYATADGSAHGGVDYTPVSGVLVFASGETTKTVTVPIHADSTVHPDRAFSLTLSDPGGGAVLGAQTTAVVAIHDDNLGGSVQFTSPTLDVSESAGYVILTVSRTGGAASGAAVAYHTADDSARFGSDYALTSGALIFSAGETTKTITVPIVDDNRAQGNRTFRVALGSPGGGATLGPVSTIAVTIHDDDAAGRVQFSAASFDVSESAGQAILTVTRTNGAAEGASVAYATADGSARAGANYGNTSGVLTFAAGETTKTITVPVMSDGRVSGDHALTVWLGLPSGGAVVGDPSSTTLTIHESAPPVELTSVRPVSRRSILSAVVLSFGGPLDPAVGEFRLSTAGRDRKFGTKDDKPVALVSTSFDASSKTITLTLRARLAAKTPVRLTANGLRDAAGRAIGAQPGGPLVVTLNAKVAKVTTRSTR